MQLRHLFRPRSVAILGASDKNPWSGLVARSLVDLGFPGPVHLVNKRGSPALGRETVTSCKDLGSVDAAFVAVPASALMDAIDDMAAGGIRYGAVVSSGFAELGGEGASEQKRIFEHAQSLGVSLLGPNSLGYCNFVDRVSLSAIPMRTPLLDSPRVGLVSQSGATAAMIYQCAHQLNISLSYSIAMGNEAMIDLADVIEFLVEDEATRVIAVFAEAIRRPERFEAAARYAAQAGKPIVVLKVGIGELTAAVAQAHTGALVGDDRVFQAICDSYNIVRVDSIEDLVVTADVLAATGRIDPRRGFALVSISGGACELVADRGEKEGVQFPAFAPETLARLSETLSEFGAAHNPLDITGAAMRDHHIYSGAIRAIGRDEAIGLVGVITELPMNAGISATDGQLHEIGSGLADLSCPGICIQQYLKPVTDHGRDAIFRHKLPVVVSGIDHAMRAIGNLYRWSERSSRPIAERVPVQLHEGVRPAGEYQTLSFLDKAGVPVIPQTLVRSRGEAVEAARRLGEDVVLKILSADIAHKTEAGGVLLGLSGAAEVGAGYERILANVASARPDAKIDGIIVSPMRRGGVELLVGIVRDPLWGLAMAVGLGGVWVELLGDTALCRLPATKGQVVQMLTSLKAAKLLQGYRGASPVDMDRLAAAIVAIGNAALSLGSDLSALEVNPLRVSGSEIEALDALAIWADP